MLNKLPSHGVLHPVQQPAKFPLPQQQQPVPPFIRFGADPADEKKAARRAAKEEMESMLGGNLKEGPMQQIVRGFVPLNFLKTLKIGLNPERKDELTPYGQLIKLALRDKKTSTPELELSVKQQLESPTPELKQWMDKYNLTYADLAEPIVDYVQIDKDAYVPPDVWQRMAKIGLFGLKVPKEFGGHQLSQKEYDATVRSLARTTGAIAGAISAHSTIGGALKLGTKEQQAKYYPALARGEYMAAFGLTEPNAGTDVARMQTTARLSDDGKNWVLNGEKIFITNTHRAGVMYVFARTDMGIHSTDKKKHTAFIVELPFRTTDTKEDIDRKRAELAKQGMIISDPLNLMMIRGSNQAHIKFKDFKVPYDMVLGGVEKIGAGLSEPFNALNAGRAGFGPTYSESANILFELAVARAKKRPMFKDYGGMQKDMPAVREKVADMAMKRAALEAFSDMVSAYIEQYEGAGYNIIAEAAAIKVLSTVDNLSIAQDAMHIYGGAGTMKDHPDGVERAYRDAWIGLIVEGVNDAMKQLAIGTSANRLGKELLKGRVDVLAKNRLMGRFQTGGLDYQDARWLHSRARRLNNKILELGAKHMANTQLYKMQGKKYTKQMETDQLNLLRMFDVAVGVLVLSAVMLKLKDNPSLQPEERVALEGYAEKAKADIDENLRKIKLWNKLDDLKEKVASAYLDEPKKG